MTPERRKMLRAWALPPGRCLRLHRLARRLHHRAGMGGQARRLPERSGVRPGESAAKFRAVLYLLFGSSASGKTTLVHDVLPLVAGVEGHDFDEIQPPPGADTAWRHRTYEAWVGRAVTLQEQGVDLLLCGQTPLGELLATPSAIKLEAISACLIDCDDATRAARLEGRGAAWFARSAGPLQEQYTWPEWVEQHLMWADWLRRHAHDPTWMPHVIRIRETENEMRWERWSAWAAQDARWRVRTVDTSTASRTAAAETLAGWIDAERDLFRREEHPLACGRWATAEPGPKRA